MWQSFKILREYPVDKVEFFFKMWAFIFDFLTHSVSHKLKSNYPMISLSEPHPCCKNDLHPSHFRPQPYDQPLHKQRSKLDSVPVQCTSSIAHWMHVWYLKGSSTCQWYFCCTLGQIRIGWGFVQISPTWVLMCWLMITLRMVVQKLDIEWLCASGYFSWFA